VDDLGVYLEQVYGDSAGLADCPFTTAEVNELQSTDEMLVYLPSGQSPADLCVRWNIRSNIDFTQETLIRTAMNSESHWFIASTSKTPELLYRSGQAARREYEEEGLHGMDLRRYLAFSAAFRWRFGVLPDQRYWCFLLAGSYDRSGVSVAGYDANGTLNHHAWMYNFKAKFAGSRYAVLAPRIELTPETESLTRAYRGQRGVAGYEAATDRMSS